MKVAVFHGSPRKGNTYKVTKIFMEALQNKSDVQFVEFFLPQSLPEFCTGCQLCLGYPSDKCPHAQHVKPILDAIIEADALIFATPHYGACSMTSSMKNLLDHLDFLTLTVAPRTEIFTKKAFIITTGTGSKAAIKPIRDFLKNWGVNRVYSLGFRMLIDKWDKIKEPKRSRFERQLQQSANKFYAVKIKSPYLSTIFMYHMSKFILKKYVGRDAYPYKYWEEMGFFKRNPLRR